MVDKVASYITFEKILMILIAFFSAYMTHEYDQLQFERAKVQDLSKEGAVIVTEGFQIEQCAISKVDGSQSIVITRTNPYK